VTTFRVTTESWVLTSAGPYAAGHIRPGTEVWALSREGAFVAQRVESVEGPASSAAVELLTKGGDVLVPEGVRLAGARGPLPVADVRPGPRQLEILRPGQATRIFPCPTPLEGLTDFRAVVPEAAGVGPSLGPALDRAGVAHTIRNESGWTVITIHRPGSLPGWSWSDEAHLLRKLTAWVGDEQRTRENDRAVRRRLLWALVAAGADYNARWIPGYRPVECRVSGADKPGAFNTVVRVRREHAEAVSVKLGDASALLVDLAYVLPL
jgi:hypothetical protein